MRMVPAKGRACGRWLLGVLMATTAVAAEWRVADADKMSGIDGLIADDPILVVQVEGDPADPRMDLRLERVNPITGALQKEEYDEIGCAPGWRHTVLADNMAAGDQVLWFLTSRVPLGPYVVVDRLSGSNSSWQTHGDPLWIVTQPVARVVPCHDMGGRISIARQPVIVAARERVRRATVRVRGADHVGQGLVINPWGHVVTSRSVVGDAEEIMVGFTGRGGGALADRVLRYRRLSDVLEPGAPGSSLPEWASPGDRLEILVPVEADGLPRFFPSFAPLVDRSRIAGPAPLTFRHAAWVYGSERGTGREIPLVPATDSGHLVPSLEVPTSERGMQPLALRYPMDDEDVGGPIYDHAGRVWGILVDPQHAQWGSAVVERYIEWTVKGLGETIRGPVPEEK